MLEEELRSVTVSEISSRQLESISILQGGILGLDGEVVLHGADTGRDIIEILSSEIVCTF